MQNSSLTKIVKPLSAPRSRAEDLPFWPRHPEIWAVGVKLTAPSAIQMMRPSCRLPRPTSRSARGRICSRTPRGSMLSRARCHWLRCPGSTRTAASVPAATAGDDDDAVAAEEQARPRLRCCSRSLRSRPSISVAVAFNSKPPMPIRRWCWRRSAANSASRRAAAGILKRAKSSKPKNGPRSPAQARHQICSSGS
jgi:hypothetical protein